MGIRLSRVSFSNNPDYMRKGLLGLVVAMHSGPMHSVPMHAQLGIVAFTRFKMFSTTLLQP